MRAVDIRGYDGAQRYLVRFEAIIQHVIYKGHTVNKDGDINRRGRTTQPVNYPNTVCSTFLALFGHIKTQAMKPGSPVISRATSTSASVSNDMPSVTMVNVIRRRGLLIEVDTFSI